MRPERYDHLKTVPLEVTGRVSPEKTAVWCAACPRWVGYVETTCWPVECDERHPAPLGIIVHQIHTLFDTHWKVNHAT